MLITMAKFQARPNNAAQLLDLARTLVANSRAEDGCLEYGCYQDIVDSNILLLFGRWDGATALEAHYESAHFRDLIQKLSAVVVEALPSVSLYEVLETDRF